MTTFEEPEALISRASMFGRSRATMLLGQADFNQGRLTFSGRLTLEQFCDVTVVHNRRWADDAGLSFDSVTQREIVDAHANGLALFILQGLIDATLRRAPQDELPEGLISALHRISARIGATTHYGLPQVTLVLADEPEVRTIKDQDGIAVAWKMLLPSGKLFSVADGQHRREATRRVRDFLLHVISNRRTPKSQKFYPAEDAPLAIDEVEAWVAIHETFRTTSVIAYEAHLNLSINEARQLFTNINCHVKPVKADLNLVFDQSNPINSFAKEWLQPLIIERGADVDLDLRVLGSINGFLFLGKTSIRQAPFDIAPHVARAREFWSLVTSLPEWKTAGSHLHDVPVLKGLAKAWFMVYLARRNSKAGKASLVHAYIKNTRFDDAWIESVPGLKTHTVPGQEGQLRFSAAHNEILALVLKHALGESV